MGEYVKILGTAVSIAAAAVVLAGCGGSGTPKSAPTATVTTTVTVTATPKPVEAACRNAIRADYEAGWSNKTDPWPPSTRKPVCAGFNRPTLQRLMDEAIADITNGTGPG